MLVIGLPLYVDCKSFLVPCLAFQTCTRKSWLSGLVIWFSICITGNIMLFCHLLFCICLALCLHIKSYGTICCSVSTGIDYGCPAKWHCIQLWFSGWWIVCVGEISVDWWLTLKMIASSYTLVCITHHAKCPSVMFEDDFLWSIETILAGAFLTQSWVIVVQVSVRIGPRSHQCERVTLDT